MSEREFVNKNFKHIINIDFRTKLLMTMFLSLTVLSGKVQYRYPIFLFAISVVPYLLLLDIREYSKCIKGLVLTSAAWAVSEFLPKNTDSFLQGILYMAAAIVIRMLPGIMAGYYTFISTSMSDMTESLRRMHMPDAFIIPVSVMFRFFYSIREDYKNINEAMKMHGLTFIKNITDPARILEYKLVPLLVCSMRTADDVAVCAMTRGMVPGSKRSSISNARLKVLDYIIMFLFAGIFIYFVIFN